MSKQKGPCAFSAACHFPGDRIRVPATNIQYCPPHARVVSLAQYASAVTSTVDAPANRLRATPGAEYRSWARYTGIVSSK